MKGRNVEEGKLKKEFGILLGLLVIICSGIWVYTEWDLRRFEETLPSPPARQPATGEASPGQHKASPREKPETPFDAVTPSPPNVVDPPNRNRVGGAESQPLNAAVVSEAAKDAHDRERLFDELLEDTQSDAFTDVFEEAPYDEAFVKAGFDDYKAYLQTDPEYAYQRLDEAFREQYGDDPDVDIIVGTVRRSNEGIVTIDDAIYHTEAMVRLMSKINPPEVVQVLVDHLEYLRETKQSTLETGDEVQHEFNYRFHVGE